MERRERIDRTALRLFAERSVAEVSVRDIATAAGIGESGLYRHMRSKEELAERVFREAYLDMSNGDFRQEIEALVETLLAAFDRDPVLFRFLVLRQHENLPSVDPGEATPVKLLLACIERAMAKGQMMRMDPEMAAAIMMGLALQPITFVLYGRIPGPAMDLKPSICAAIERALGVTCQEQAA
jgi:AcrR family transcriptional regulator